LYHSTPVIFFPVFTPFATPPILFLFSYHHPSKRIFEIMKWDNSTNYFPLFFLCVFIQCLVTALSVSLSCTFSPLFISFLISWQLIGYVFSIVPLLCYELYNQQAFRWRNCTERMELLPVLNI
jgi:hypothetical protein